MPTAERVMDVLAQIAETDEVRADPDLHLFNRKVLDSLQTVELILALAREFCVEISPAEFDRHEWATPRMIVARIEQKLGISPG